VRRNVSQGLPLRLQERQAAARKLLSMNAEWSDRMIASICGLSPTTVREIRLRSTARFAQLSTRIGADGRVRPINSEGLHQRIAEAIHANPKASLREIGRMVQASPTTVSKVRAHASAHSDMKRQGSPSKRSPSGSTSPVAAEDGSRIAWEHDSALRARATGTDLLEWFCRTNISEEWHQHAETVPLSRVYEMADEARRRAACWARFAEAVEARANPGSNPDSCDNVGRQSSMTCVPELSAKRGVRATQRQAFLPTTASAQ
jgi:hypothetical protein